MSFVKIQRAQPVESQFNGVIGDINGDAVVNVLDVIQTVNMALGSQDPNYNTADLNSDGIINVLDIVLIVNIVLGPRINDATEASVNIYDNSIGIVFWNNVSISLDKLLGYCPFLRSLISSQILYHVS